MLYTIGRGVYEISKILDGFQSSSKIRLNSWYHTRAGIVDNASQGKIHV